MNSTALDIYHTKREQLLAKMVSVLSAHQFLLAGWLTGSFARQEADSVSDLDLNLVVAHDRSESLCARSHMVGAGTTDSRLEIIRQFGQPTILHENHHNAPDGGSFTFVLYAESALMVDWIFIPQLTAQRPEQSQLLFDKVGIPIRLADGPELVGQRIELLAEKIAFFWMIMAVTAKYVVRQDVVQVQIFLETLQRVLEEIQRLLAGEPSRYRRGSRTQLCVTREQQIQALLYLGHEMQQLTPGAIALGVSVPASPLSTLQILLDL